MTLALQESCQTGKIGDGKIFVLPVEDAIRIRTGRARRPGRHQQLIALRFDRGANESAAFAKLEPASDEGAGSLSFTETNPGRRISLPTLRRSPSDRSASPARSSG